MVIASYTGWSMESLLDLPVSTFLEFIELLPKKESSQ